jgi:thymidylate synthase (FAD)
MKIIHPSVEYWSQANTLDGIWEHAARCARVCYQSQPVKEGESGKDFLLRTIAKNGFRKDKSSHMSVLEHSTVYLRVTNAEGCFHDMKDKYLRNHYSRIVVEVYDNDLSNRGIPFSEAFITTNLRVLVENDWLDDLRFIADDITKHKKRYTFSIITNLGVSREINRHREHSKTAVDGGLDPSVSEESTRYCNYSKDKFDNRLTFVIPAWSNLEEGTVVKKPTYAWDHYKYDYYLNDKLFTSVFEIKDDERKFTDDFVWLIANKHAEEAYLLLLANGQKPQQAREVLPLSLKTQVIHTAFEDDWRNFIALRSEGISGAPHPNAKQVADKVKYLIEHM